MNMRHLLILSQIRNIQHIYFILMSTVDVIIYVDQASGTSKDTIVPKGK